MTEQENRRILLVDDTPSIHEDFKKILNSSSAQQAPGKLSDAKALFMGAGSVRAEIALATLQQAGGGQIAGRVGALACLPIQRQGLVATLSILAQRGDLGVARLAVSDALARRRVGHAGGERQHNQRHGGETEMRHAKPP